MLGYFLRAGAGLAASWVNVVNSRRVGLAPASRTNDNWLEISLGSLSRCGGIRLREMK